MKLIAKTRWQYYVANVVQMLAIVGFLVWYMARAITTGIDLLSIFFWIALVMLIALFYGVISFFSSMKSVEVTGTALVITYVFQKHRNVIQFSEIASMKSNKTQEDKLAGPRTMRDTFQLNLADGRVFEFHRSQFHQYQKLKAACWKHLKK